MFWLFRTVVVHVARCVRTTPQSVVHYYNILLSCTDWFIIFDAYISRWRHIELCIYKLYKFLLYTIRHLLSMLMHTHTKQITLRQNIEIPCLFDFELAGDLRANKWRNVWMGHWTTGFYEPKTPFQPFFFFFSFSIRLCVTFYLSVCWCGHNFRHKVACSFASVGHAKILF